MTPLDYRREYERLKDPCVAAMRRRHRLPVDEAEVVYQTAWVELWLYLRKGRTVESLQGFLLDVMTKRHRDDLRRAHRQHEELVGFAGGDEDGGGLATAIAPGPDPADYDDRVQIRYAAEVLDSILADDTLRAIFYLVWFEDATRQEAASELGMAWSRPLEKRIDRASKRLREKLGAVRAGEWCEHQRVLVRDFAESRLEHDGEPYVRARRHLDGCPACRYYVLTLRGMCAAGPPAPLLAGIALSGIGVVASSAAGTSAGAGAAGAAAAAGTAGLAVGGGSASALLGGFALKAVTVAIAVTATTSAVVVTEPGPSRGDRERRHTEREGKGAAAHEVVPAASAAVLATARIALPPPPVPEPSPSRSQQARTARAPRPRRKRVVKRPAPVRTTAPATPVTAPPPAAPPPGVQTVAQPKPVAPPRKDSASFTSEFSP